MIPRSQRILLWGLLLASVIMAVVLNRLRERAADRLVTIEQNTATEELSLPQGTAAESVILLEANDSDGSIAPVTRQIALPKESGARARVLLRQLFADFAAPESKHPLPAGPGVEQVFFMPATTLAKVGSSTSNTGAQLAVVNLTRAFAENQPSGIEPETLSLLSIIGTLHENFPNVEQVRFLVDGAPRDTLAGHADLTRTYLTGAKGTHP
jgi:hypothetical protein